MNWGTNLTALGAIRSSGWLALTTLFATVTAKRFRVLSPGQATRVTFDPAAGPAVLPPEPTGEKDRGG